MAETIKYLVEITPRFTETTETSIDGGYSKPSVLSATNFAAVKLLFTKINAGVDVSTVVTAINAL